MGCWYSKAPVQVTSLADDPRLVRLDFLRARGPARLQQNDPLLQSARSGDAAALRSLLGSRADVNARGPNGDTPAHWAVHGGHSEVFAVVLEMKGDVHAVNDDRFALTHVACARQPVPLSILRRLLQARASATARTNGGDTPSCLVTARSGHTRALRSLLEARADANTRNATGDSLVHFALHGGHQDALDLLLEHRADVHVRNDCDDTPLHIAAQDGRTSAISQLLALRADVGARNASNNTPACYATKNGHAEAVGRLLERRSEVNAQSNTGNSLVHWAVFHGHAEAFSLLLDHRADANLRNLDADTPAHVAAAEGRAAPLARLLDCRAELEARSDTGNTPAALAVRNGHVACLWHLLARRGDVNAQNSTGESLAHWAIHGDHFEIFRVLIDGAADVNAVNSDDVSLLHSAAASGHVEMLRVLLERQADVNAQSSKCDTAAIFAAFTGNTEALELLISWHADMSMRNASGLSPAVLASRRGHSKAAQMCEEGLQGAPFWAISYEQLMEIQAEAQRELGEDFGKATMHDIVERLVKPVCARERVSYARWKNARRLRRAKVFVTHCWSENFSQFVWSVQAAFGTWRKTPTLWICAFALLQGDSSVVAAQLDTPIPDEPFMSALRAADHLLVVRNRNEDLYSRAWCVCELLFAKKFGLVEKDDGIMIAGPNSFAGSTATCLDCTASKIEDKAKILKALLEEWHDFMRVDELITELRVIRRQISPEIISL